MKKIMKYLIALTACLIVSQTNVFADNSSDLTDDIESFTNDQEGTLTETESGWGIFIPNSEEYYIFSCPENFADEIPSLEGTSVFQMKKDINDLYANQFHLYLDAYIEDKIAYEEAITDLLTHTAAFTSNLKNPATAYQMGLNSIIAADHAASIERYAENLIELHDGMAFYYIEMYRESNN